MTDGDLTVPLISLGAMCHKGWRTKRLNPAGARVVTREKPHIPNNDLRCGRGQGAWGPGGPQDDLRGRGRSRTVGQGGGADGPGWGESRAAWSQLHASPSPVQLSTAAIRHMGPWKGKDNHHNKGARAGLLVYHALS